MNVETTIQWLGFRDEGLSQAEFGCLHSDSSPFWGSTLA